MVKRLVTKIWHSGNMHALLGNMFFAAFNFLTFILLVRNTDKALFGEWVIFVTMASLIDMLRLGLTGTAAIRNISGNKQPETVIGASYQLSILSTVALSGLFFILSLLLSNSGQNAAYIHFLKYYPLLALANLAYQQALVVVQGKSNFKPYMHLKIALGALYLILVFMTIKVSGRVDLVSLTWIYILSHFSVSVVAMVFGLDGLKQIRAGNRDKRRAILRFGKYSTASFVGSNLLRSSDTILLSAFTVMGAEAIAILAIPMKFIEIVEIPLRSFTTTAFPRLSNELNKGYQGFMKILLGYVGKTTLLLIPFIIPLLVFPEFFLNLLGGDEYQNAMGLQVAITYIISLYIIILPTDRFSGVALFALNKPELNFYKISFMLVCNIVFNLIAILVFQSIVLVALGTVLFTLFGMVFGYYLLIFKTGLKNHFQFSALYVSTQAYRQKWKVLTNK